MDAPALKDVFERAAKKQKLTYAKTGETLDKLLHEVTHARQLLTSEGLQGSDHLAIGPSDHQDHQDHQAVLANLHSAVAAINAPEQIGVLERELNVALGKYSKALDRTFTADVTRACRAVDFDPGLVNQVIAQHLFREGRFELGERFVAEAGLAFPEEEKAPFHEMYRVLEEIRRRNLGPALEWVRVHRDELAQRDPHGASPSLEFRLHQLHYLHLLESSGQDTALIYARTSFAPFATSHFAEIKRLMGCILWAGRLEASPYTDLLAEAQWGDVAGQFARECCNLMGEAYKCPLSTTINAGAAALPMILKLAQVMASKKQDWATCAQLPLEIELDKEFQFHSIFACPVSREQSTVDNPPMLMQCGHVLCKQSIQKLAKGSQRAFKCPYCPVECTLPGCRQVQF